MLRVETQYTYLIYEASSTFEGWKYSLDFLGIQLRIKMHMKPPEV